MKIVGLAAIAVLGVATLAGCSGSTAEETSAAPNPAPTVQAEGNTSTPTPTVGNLDDALCAAAQESIEVSETLVGRTDDLTAMLSDPSFLTAEDATELNAWGDDMLELSNQTLEFYTIGVQETQGEDINADFAALETFVTKYTITLSQDAADAASPAAFVEKIQVTFTDPDVQDAVSAAPAASARVAEYLATRCGITG
ncbi:hypothetical protein [Demequina sp.]|uniref:hypothetical protein n=1 Tax=Demequina sp. TaxID=2050685 RepID=UPI003D132CCE